MKHFSNNIKNAVDKLEYFEEKVREVLNRGPEQFLENYIEGDTLYLYIQGWTPNFNDGELCLHSVDWCEGEEIVNYEHHINNASIFEGITEKELIESRRIHEVDSKNFLDFRRCVNAVIKYCDYKYETNYQCLFICKNNSLTFIKEDYEVGY